MQSDGGKIANSQTRQETNEKKRRSNPIQSNRKPNQKKKLCEKRIQTAVERCVVSEIYEQLINYFVLTVQFSSSFGMCMKRNFLSIFSFFFSCECIRFITCLNVHLQFEPTLIKMRFYKMKTESTDFRIIVKRWWFCFLLLLLYFYIATFRKCVIERKCTRILYGLSSAHRVHSWYAVVRSNVQFNENDVNWKWRSQKRTMWPMPCLFP